MSISKIILLLFVSSVSYAESGKWLGPERSTWTDTEYRKTENDFGGWLIVTPDMDWKEKWNTHPDTVPYFNEAKSVKVGNQIVILTFFVNPKTNEKKQTNVLCDIKVTRPDKSVSINQKGIICMQGELQGNPDYIRLAPAVINFTGEESDPVGKWDIEVGISDVFRKTKLQLKTSFVLEGK